MNGTGTWGVLLLLLAMPAVGGVAVPASDTAAGGGSGLLQGLSFTAEKGPVEITADRLEFDYQGRELTYAGRVQVRQGEMLLEADRVRVHLSQSEPLVVREIVADGSVHIAQGGREASGGRAVFDQKTRTVTLSEKAVLRDGRNEVSGERVVVYLDEQRSVVQGGGRQVRARLFPSDSDSASGTPAAQPEEAHGE